tara:strand:+ start:409 stop:792 length:384 start_codon:yes stop_codon:yes gene_type:complete
MINDFLIIHCIGIDDKLGLRINKDFFVEKLINKKKTNDNLVLKIQEFLSTYNVKLDNNFTIIVNQGPGSFSAIRTSLAVAKGLNISKNVKLFGFKSIDLKAFNQENIEKLIDKKLLEKKLIKPIYLS